MTSRRDDAIFWERLADMPWVEAEQECVSRREQLALQHALLMQERSRLLKKSKEHHALGVEIIHLNSQFTLLNERIKYLRKVQDQVSWRKAVTAIFGHEGWEQCAEWIAQSEGRIRSEGTPR